MKKFFALLLAAVCLCAVLAACGNQNAPETPSSAVDVTKIATIGEAKALAGKGEEQSGFGDAAYVYAFELNGGYWRLKAALSDEQSEALWALGKE